MSDEQPLHKKGLNYALFLEKRIVFLRQEDPLDKQRRLAEAQERIEKAKSEAEQAREREGMKDIQVPVDETRAKVVKTGIFDKEMTEGVEAERILRARAIDQIMRLKNSDRKKYEAIVSKLFGKPENRKVRWYRRLRSKWEESAEIVDTYIAGLTDFEALKPPEYSPNGTEFVDMDGISINFKDKNKFAVTDDKGKSGYVIIDWFNDTLLDVEGKLKSAKLWRWFEQTPEGKDFINFREKYGARNEFLRDTVLKEIFSRETSVVSRAGFDGKELLKSLHEDQAQEIWRDREFLYELRAHEMPGLTQKDIPSLSADEKATFNGIFAEAQDRLWKKSINYLLKRILGDDIHAKVSIDDPDNYAARAALRVIVGKLGDESTRFELVDFLKTLANEPTETIDAITKLREAITTLLETINDAFAKRNEIEEKVKAKNKQITALENEKIELKDGIKSAQDSINAAKEAREKQQHRIVIERSINQLKDIREGLKTADDELVALKLERDAPNKAIINAISELGAQLREHQYWKSVLDLEEIFEDGKIKEIMRYGQNPPTFPGIEERDKFVVGKLKDTFSVDHDNPSNPSFEGSINRLDDQLEDRIRREQKKQLRAITSTGQLSARDLLVLLHDHDLEQNGETNETERFKKALTIANLHAAQCRTADEALPADRAIARTLHGNEFRRALRDEIHETRALDMFSPYTSAETALFLLTNIEKFRFLREINTSSTPYEIQRMIDKYNEQHPEEPVTSEVLREFTAHMQKFITGINVPGMDAPKRVIDAHVRRFEGLKNVIMNTSEVAFVQSVIDEIPEQVEGDKQKVLIDLLKRKNEERASADLQIKESLKATMDQESDPFHRYMDKQNLIDDYRKEMEEVENNVGTFWDGIKEAARQVTEDAIPMDTLRYFHERKYAAMNAARRNSKIPKEYRSQLKGRAFLREAKDFTTYVLRYPLIMGFQLAYGLHKTPGIIGRVGKWSWVKLVNAKRRFQNWYNKPS